MAACPLETQKNHISPTFAIPLFPFKFYQFSVLLSLQGLTSDWDFWILHGISIPSPYPKPFVWLRLIPIRIMGIVIVA